MMFVRQKHVQPILRAVDGRHGESRQGSGPLPLRGPFAWFRLGIVVLAAVIALLWLLGSL